MNLPKIRASFAAIAAAIAYLIVPSTSAAILATNNFETACDGFVADIDGEDASALTAYNADQPSSTAPYPFTGSGAEGFGSNYLKVDTGDATLFREFAAQTSSTYLDAYMQFEPTSGEISYTNVAKIVVYLDAATSNLCVISGTAENDRTTVTNRLDTDTATEGPATVVPGTWGRLTVNAIKTSSDIFSFNVLLNGKKLSAGATDTFYSLTDSNAVSRVGFKGTGALDDFVARTTDPYGTAAKIGDETYGSLEHALNEANGATVTLTADHADTVAVTKSGTYVVDKGSYTFGGVVGTEGSYVSSSTSGNVDTYTVKLLVTVWDGATAAYDFSTLTRTLGDTTYTMAVNDANAAINSAKDYITIGSEDQKWTVKISADTAGAFGSTANSGFTVIAKVANAGTSESSNRAILNYYTSSTQAGATFAHTPTGCAFPMVNDTAYQSGGSPSTGSRQSVAGTLKSDGSIQTLALSYGTNPQGGTAFYVDGELIYKEAAMTSSSFTTPEGLTLGGVPIDNSNKLYALKGMKIYALAAFSSKLTDAEVAAYTFPSETPMSGTVAVSDINALFGTKSEINVHLADDTTVTGDTTFNASTVHFAGAGEVVVYPPTGNATTFDFSGVSKPVVAYSGAIPSRIGSTFTSNSVPTWVTDSAQWTGTVWVKNYNGITADNFNPNDLGNDSSTLRLTMIRGYLKAKQSTSVLTTTFNPAIELDDDGNGYSLCIHDAYSYGGSYSEYTIFRELKGDGTFVGRRKDDGQGGPYALFQIQNWGNFTGTISLTNQIVSFGSTIPAAIEFSNENYGRNGGLIFVMPNTTVTIPAGKTWYAANTNYTGYANGSIIVKGELQATDINQIDAASTVTTTDTGTFTLTSTGNPTSDGETDTSYARITGTGKLKYEGTGWRALSASNFPTNMTLVNEQTGDLLLSRALTYTVGSFAGSKNLQGNYGSGDRYLRVLQAKDTEWSGKITADSYNRLKGLIVAPGESTAGTLTLSGTQTQSATLTVEAGAKVNITGTWVGAVTVAGELGGTGTITGNVTLSPGAKLNVANLNDTLTVTGNLDAGGTIDILLPEGTTIDKSTQFITVTGTVAPNATFNVYINGAKSAIRVAPTEDGHGLKLYRAPIVFLL